MVLPLGGAKCTATWALLSAYSVHHSLTCCCHRAHSAKCSPGPRHLWPVTSHTRTLVFKRYSFSSLSEACILSFSVCYRSSQATCLGSAANTTRGLFAVEHEQDRDRDSQYHILEKSQKYSRILIKYILYSKQLFATLVLNFTLIHNDVFIKPTKF